MLHALEASPGQVEVADDHGQQIVEIVRDAPRDFSDRLELLGLLKFDDHAFALGRFSDQRDVGGLCLHVGLRQSEVGLHQPRIDLTVAAQAHLEG